MSKQSIRFYNDREVRAIWNVSVKREQSKRVCFAERVKLRVKPNEEENGWYFSIVDVVAAITGSPRPRVYWGTMKNRQKGRFAQLYSKCIQLKLTSAEE